jgi:hypothetical protein
VGADRSRPVPSRPRRQHGARQRRRDRQRERVAVHLTGSGIGRCAAASGTKFSIRSGLPSSRPVGGCLIDDRQLWSCASWSRRTCKAHGTGCSSRDATLRFDRSGSSGGTAGCGAATFRVGSPHGVARRRLPLGAGRDGRAPLARRNRQMLDPRLTGRCRGDRSGSTATFVIGVPPGLTSTHDRDHLPHLCAQALDEGERPGADAFDAPAAVAGGRYPARGSRCPDVQRLPPVGADGTVAAPQVNRGVNDQGATDLAPDTSLY